jgi:hypothetical protein
MPLPKELTLQDLTNERNRAKRALVRVQDNLAGATRQRSEPRFRRALPDHSLKKDYDREWTARVRSYRRGT